MDPEDTALEGMGAAPAPVGLELNDGIRVGHMRGRSLRFEFEGPARPIAARLHHGDDLHGPQSTGAGAVNHVEFRLSQLQGVE